MPVAFAAVAAFAANPLGGAILEIGASLAVEAVGGLIHDMTAPKGDKPASAAAEGISGTVSTGGDGPIAFIMGHRATAGTLCYRGSWGSAGKTPNAYYVEERVLSDVPLADLSGLIINKKHLTVLWNESPATQGYPIQEYRVGGVDYGWLQFADGTQTTPNAYLRAKFGSDPDHPYTATMIGRGQAKAVLTLRANRKLFPNGFPDWMIETSGTKLYNIAKDSSRGGAGTHRVNNPATWEASSLLPVHILNTLLGIRYGSEWVWGGQNITIDQLPASNWIAAIAEAGSTVAKVGGTEKQYTGGFEVTGDMEPASYIEECLKGCNGRIAEVGGSYKMLCNLPSSPVYSFTDANIVVTRQQGYDPFPEPSNVYNTIFSKYYEPLQGWTAKDVPPRYNTAFEAVDGGRRGPDNTYEVVYSGTQAQRLDKAAITEGRRFTTHLVGLGPDASELEPLDMVGWTSARRGYTAKQFLIFELDDEETYEQAATIREIDPTDFGYVAADDEKSTFYPTVDLSGPAPQAVSGYQVFGDTFLSSAGDAIYPTIRARIPNGLDDVAAIHITARLKSSTDVVFDADLTYRPTADTGTYDVKLNGVFQPLTQYEVRFDERPFGIRDTTPSAWLTVTMPAALIVPKGGLTQAQLNKQLADAINVIIGTGTGTLAGIQAALHSQIDGVAGSAASGIASLSSELDEVKTSADGTSSALSNFVTQKYATDQKAVANSIQISATQTLAGLAAGLFATHVVGTPTLSHVQLSMVARITPTGPYTDTGILVDLNKDSKGVVTSQITMTADSIYMTDDGKKVKSRPMYFKNGVLTLGVADIGVVKAGRLQSPDNRSWLDLNASDLRLST